jgi:tRNA1(Val) A37 N6-methylase TrmN6
LWALFIAKYSGLGDSIIVAEKLFRQFVLEKWMECGFTKDVMDTLYKMAFPFATTEDAFHGGKLSVLQAKQGSRAGLDAMFLAAACPAVPGLSVLEAGTGSGVVLLAVASRVSGISATGIEIDPALAQLAGVNAARNGLSHTIRIIRKDVTAPLSTFTESGLAFDSFDHVLANPPFLISGKARLSPEPRLQVAHSCTREALERWVKFLTAFCKPKGTLTLVHRADTLSQILPYLEGRFGALTIYPLFPREGEAASRVLIQGRKGSRTPMRLMRGMVLHESGNTFTPAANAILRDGEGLNIG